MSAFGTYLYTYASLCLSALVLCSGIFLISCLAVRKRSGASPKRQALWFVTLWYLISLSMILFTTGHSGENNLNLYPLRSIYSAVADTGVSLSQLIIRTSGLFIPFGFLLTLVIRRRRLQYFIPLFSLVYALALEGLQLLFGYGSFDIDRPILGMLGTLFGGGLCAMIFPTHCGGRRNIVWHCVETAVPVALTAALLISYSARPYGYLPCETGSPYEVKRAAVDCSMIADMLPSKLELYSLAAPSGSTDAAADDVFSALGFTRDRSYKSAYDSVLLYRSTDAQALLWCYNDATFNFTLYSGGESGGSDPFELVYKLLDSIGRPLPAGLTREIADDDEYRLTADFLHSGDEIYNGSVNFSVHDGRLEYLDYELYTMLPLGEEYTLSADGVARLIRRGEFICTGGVMISSEIDEVQCRTVNIVYAGDSKNFYRPMYSIEAVINGGVATILLPAF